MSDHSGKNENRKWIRHIRNWNLITAIISRWIPRKFNFTYDDFGIENIEGPVIVIPNHSCAWDPLFIGLAMRKRQMYFVASEHILRWRVAGPVINRLVEPIPRKKAGMATGTVRSCLRHLRAGHSVCLFAEGEQTWDGVSKEVFPATGKLVKQSGATLVTYRLEGAYLSMPRWAYDVRKGMVHGHAAGIYPPEVLKKMSAGEVNRLINKDIYVDTWQWQQNHPQGPVSYAGKGDGYESARGLERALFICPSCLKAGTLRTEGDRIMCSCGFSSKYLDTGFLDQVSKGSGTQTPERVFRTISEWDQWEIAEMERQLQDLTESGNGCFFSDHDAKLSKVEDGHNDVLISEGRLSLAAENGKLVLHAGERSFEYSGIDMMAPVLSSILLFSAGGEYYQIKAENTNIRKYVLAWESGIGKE